MSVTRELVTLQYNTYNRSLVPLMPAWIVVMDAFEDLTEEQAAFVDRYFETMYIRYSPRWRWMPQDHFH